MLRCEMTFNKGSILRKEMLEELYDYPRVALESYYDSYTDGILYGMEWKESIQNTGHHIITPGALKYHGQIYFLKSPIEVESLIDEKLKIDNFYRLFFMKKEEVTQKPSQIIYELTLESIQSNKLEEARKKGFYYAYIRYDHNRRAHIINDEKEVYGLFAANDGYNYKLPPYLIKEQLKELLENKEYKHPLDFILLREIYNEKGLSVSIARLYLQETLKEKSSLDMIINNPKELIDQLKKACEKLKLDIDYTAVSQDNIDIKKDKEYITVHEGGSL